MKPYRYTSKMTNLEIKWYGFALFLTELVQTTVFALARKLTVGIYPILFFAWFFTGICSNPFMNPSCIYK